MTDQSPVFIFAPGIWIGEGAISWTASPTKVRFFTRWEVSDLGEKGIRCRQTVELEGVEEHVINLYTFFHISEAKFQVVLENEILEKVTGEGWIDSNRIAWEFRGSNTFEGFEVYERGENGVHRMHAEYSSPDQFRTTINGVIWKKAV